VGFFSLILHSFIPTFHNAAQSWPLNSKGFFMALRICAPAAVAQARLLYETTDASYSQTASQSGLSPTSVARYARKQGWRKGLDSSTASPESAARLALRLWSALEKRIAAVERAPEDAPVRDYVALARALRDLAALTPTPEGDLPEIADGDELRAALVARLERILPDEGDAIASHRRRP
jgi:hypothetical protein